MCGEIETVRFCLENGVDVDAVWRGITGLHEAACTNQTAMIDFLIASGADQTLKDAMFNATPYGWAAHTHSEEAMQMLK